MTAEQERLGRLLAPSRIALVGQASAGLRVARANRALGYAGDLVAVHPAGPVPEYPDAGVSRTVDKVQELPDPPDAAFIAVPATEAVDIVAALADRGCGGAVLYSSGFAETGAEGVALQEKLRQAAGSMPLLGPNCYGLLNYRDRVAIWPDQHGGTPLGEGARGVALVAQSSSIAISLTMQHTGLPLAYLATVGNGAVLGAAGIAEQFARTPGVSAVGLLVESLADTAGYERLAEVGRTLGVPVVALVLGRSDEAKSTALSHSASMSADDAVWGDFLGRIGIGEVTSVDGLLGALALLHGGGPLGGPRLASLSSSGGEAALMADAAGGQPVHFPPLSPAQREGLAAALGPRVTLGNPLDYHTYVWADRDAMAPAFDAMTTDDVDLTLLYADLPRPDRCDAADWQEAVTAFTDPGSDGGRPGRRAIVTAMAGMVPEELAARLLGAGYPVLSPVGVAIEAATAGFRIGEAWSRPEPEPIHGRTASTPGPALSEAAGKDRLAAAGVRVPGHRVARSADEASQAALRIDGPVVLKGIGPAHKSEQAAVVVGLTDPAQVQAAATDLVTRFGAVLVEPMVTDCLVELLVAVDPDPVFGPVLTVGRGGVETELLRDVARLVLPASRERIHQALTTLSCWPLLTGFRDRPAADLDEVLDQIEAIASIPARTVEVNPLMVTPTLAVAADALVQEHGPDRADQSDQPYESEGGRP